MVKIKAICRDSNDYKRKTNTEIEKIYRNTNPKLHPFQKAREYIRALNSVKLDKIFSKPFLFSLSQPTDCIKVMWQKFEKFRRICQWGVRWAINYMEFIE